GARVVVADLIYAQNRAIATNVNQWVRFNVDNQQYVLTDAGETSPIPHPVHKFDYRVRLGQAGVGGAPDVTLVSADFGDSATLACDPLGQPMSVAEDGTQTVLTSVGVIELRSGTYALQVQVQPFT